LLDAAFLLIGWLLANRDFRELFDSFSTVAELGI
jgi:hypothetical protein